jgi:hypothetical protein
MWSETETYFEGPVSFVDSTYVDVQVRPTGGCSRSGSR